MRCFAAQRSDKNEACADIAVSATNFSMTGLPERKKAMIYDLQKASITKRISAFLLDVILFVILTTGAMALISLITGFDGYIERIDGIRIEYCNEYGIDPDASDEELAQLTDEEKARYEAADAAFSKDEEAVRLYQTVLSLVLLMVSISPFIGCLVVDFVIPLFLRNGQTPGKKIFGIGVMMVNGVKVTSTAVFVRALLGKYVLETAVPMLLIVMALFGLGEATILFAVVFGIIAVNAAFLFFNSKRSLLHDYLSYTVCVDMASQMIFDNVDEMEAYKAKVAADRLSLD